MISLLYENGKPRLKVYCRFSSKILASFIIDIHQRDTTYARGCVASNLAYRDIMEAVFLTV